MSARRLNISFSGGRTSGLMLKMLLDQRARWDEIAVTFANTGQEDERTLEFVHRVDQAFDAHVVWLEAVVDPREGVGTKHRIVTFETAHRGGDIFESAIAKYGIPNYKYRGICTRELKLRPIDSYLRSIGWAKGTYDTAVGIRADEFDRMNPRRREERLIYPLLNARITKQDVLNWWREQPFDLTLPDEHFGNCVWCWKKSLRKHLTLVTEAPEVFDFPRRMEQMYAHAGRGDGQPRRFFRENRSVDDLFALAQKPFEPFASSRDLQIPLLPLDVAGSCSESCEAYGEEAAA